jgi:hypothetical protein
MYTRRLALLGIMLGTLWGVLCPNAIGRPLPQQPSRAEPVAVPTKVSKLTESRNAVDDAYSRWLKQDFRYDQLLKLKPEQAKQRLKDAREANVKLHEANRQYHEELRTSYQQARDTLINVRGASSVDSGMHDATLDGLGKDLLIVDSQIARIGKAAGGPAIVAVEGLKQQKQRIEDLQLFLLKMKARSEEVAKSAKEAQQAREAVLASIDEALVRLNQYASDDEQAAKNVEHLLSTYEPLLEGRSPPPRSVTDKAKKPPPGGEVQTNKVTASLQRLIGRWTYSNPGAGLVKKGTYGVKQCEVEIQEGGKGWLRCEFWGVPKSNRADVAFGLQLTRMGPSPNSLVGVWSEGGSRGDLTVTLRQDNTLELRWETKKDGGDFYIRECCELGRASLRLAFAGVP